MTATLYGPQPACGGSGLPTWHNAAEWNGAPPACYGSWRQFTIPADPAPSLKRRSESKYGATQADVEVHVGMTSRMTGAVLTKLGAAGSATRNWHCVSQLIGPNYDGTWAGGAAVALMVRDGRWRLEQGGGDWAVDLAPYIDNTAQTVDLSVVASETKGRVFGKLGMTSFDFAAPTFWHQYLIWSHGLYRGSGNDPFPVGNQPTYQQDVFWKDVTITNTWPAPIA